MLPEWKKQLVLSLKQRLSVGNEKLTFIHIPKCAGTFAVEYFAGHGIVNKGHQRPDANDGVTFAIIRDPIERFESLINFRLNQSHAKPDFPKKLRAIYNYKKDINTIVSKMTKKDILGFTPFRTLEYWTPGIDLLITIEELAETMFILKGIPPKQLPRLNVSKKKYGKLSKENKAWLEDVLAKDLEVWKRDSRMV